MDESLLSTRNVAEHVYCPRLFYYMQVEGIFVPSSDTEKGVAVHRRVNKPSASPEKTDISEDDPERPKVLRSLTLTSESLGLTATLDLAEISGVIAVPVEYRKGRPRRVALKAFAEGCSEMEQLPLSHPEPWPTDRIQVGLQALLLESAGYTVHEAILYYAEEKLRLSIAVDDALKTEALTTLESAKRCAEGSRPPPWSMTRAALGARSSRYVCPTRSTISASNLQATMSHREKSGHLVMTVFMWWPSSMAQRSGFAVWN